MPALPLLLPPPPPLPPPSRQLILQNTLIPSKRECLSDSGYCSNGAFSPTLRALDTIETGESRIAESDHSPREFLGLVKQSPKIQDDEVDSPAATMPCPPIDETRTTEIMDDLTSSIHRDSISSSMPSTPPTISPPTGIITNEWLLPLRNHPSFPELLQAWNNFVQRVTGHGNQEASHIPPSLPSSSADSSFQSQGSSSSNQNKRKRASSGDDDDHEPRSSKERVRVVPGSGEENEKKFACHFLKLDVTIYGHEEGGCLYSGFKDIRTTRQHLKTNHGVTPETIPLRFGQGKSERAKWYLYWEKLFPGQSPPKSPYAAGLGDVISQFITRVRESHPELHDTITDLERLATNWTSPSNEAHIAVQTITPASVVTDAHSSSTPIRLDRTPIPNVTTPHSENITTPYLNVERNVSAQVAIRALSIPAEMPPPSYADEVNAIGAQLSSYHSQFLAGEATLITNVHTATHHSPNIPRSSNELHSMSPAEGLEFHRIQAQSGSPRNYTAAVGLQSHYPDARSIHMPFSSTSGFITNATRSYGTLDQSLTTVDDPPTQTTHYSSMLFDNIAPADWEVTPSDNQMSTYAGISNIDESNPMSDYWPSQHYDGTGDDFPGILHGLHPVSNSIPTTPTPTPDRLLSTALERTREAQYHSTANSEHFTILGVNTTAQFESSSAFVSQNYEGSEGPASSERSPYVPPEREYIEPDLPRIPQSSCLHVYGDHETCELCDM